MGFNILGSKTKTVFLTTEADKTTVEFEAGVDIKKGQPVMLQNNGKIQVWDKVSNHTLVGYAYADVTTGNLVTVWTRGYAMIYGLSNAAMVAGPVTYNAYDAATNIGGVTGYSKYIVAADAATTNGWSLDQAGGANTLIRILLMD